MDEKKQTARAHLARAPSGFDGFSKRTIAFLRGIAAHNEKAWFDAHRTDYDEAFVAPALAFVIALGPRLEKISKTIRYEPRVNGSLFRIQRDIRFSKDKRPYKDHLDLWFWEGDEKGWDTPGFFFRLTAKSLVFGAGMHHFEKGTLDAYRTAVLDDRRGKALVTAIAKVAKSGLYTIGGKRRVKLPKGVPATHPRADLLLHDALYATIETKHPPEVSSAKLIAWCARHASNIAPLHAWLTSMRRK